MPGFDGTGPRGMGPRTGGGRGFCPPVGLGRGAYGAGGFYGRPRGWGRGYGYAYPYSPYYAPGYGAAAAPQTEIAYLRSQADMIRDHLREIEARIKDLEISSQ